AGAILLFINDISGSKQGCGIRKDVDGVTETSDRRAGKKYRERDLRSLIRQNPTKKWGSSAV
ncbi:hypothetical protein, partial [Yersinia enterocolitica]|uniref:hypothetical protein n=1 Tax=Yersinia enterocolitica TaxID=630 RepID=UPI001C1225F5